MKKILLIICLGLALTGCTNVKKMNYNEILATFNNKALKSNVYRRGYKYHLPRGMVIEDNISSNDVISDVNNKYYLFVDLISYDKKITKDIAFSDDAIYKENIHKGSKFGYVQIKKMENNKYLIEIMYNYAKIEVIVDKKDINESLVYSIEILNSIIFNDDIISNLLAKDQLGGVEEEINIFNTTSSDSTYIKIDDTYQDVEDDDEIDTDLIK